MKTFESIKLEFGVYKNTILFKADGGFAAEAWCKGDTEYHEIAARSFIAITSDDCKKYNIGRSEIRRLDSEEEFKTLLEKAHPAFKRLVELWHLGEIVSDKMIVEHYRKMREHFNTSSKYSYIYGVHLFKNEDGLWTHEFAVFNENESNLPEEVCDVYKDSLPTWDDVVEFAHKTSGWMAREDCEQKFGEEGSLYVFEFYCN